MADKRRTGKLAVILHADIAGSTALVQRDERLAHERIQETFRRFSEIITQYHGRVHELRGDALLAEFERASDAVTAALALQADQFKYNNQIIDDIQPAVRVGIAMGEVIVADNTVTGAGVVLAQRVEQLAQPGGVVIQGAAYETIPGRFPFDYEDLGEHEVKGFEKTVRALAVTLRVDNAIPEPAPEPKNESHRNRMTVVVSVSVAIVVAGFTVLWVKPWEPSVEPASVERMVFSLPDKPSIAVLPFNNMSGDVDQEYFVDGMTEDLITDLSKISGLFVIARNSVFTYKDKSVKVGQVAEELGVRYVLEGSVRRAGDQVRINAQLIDTSTGGHLWAERYDGSLADVFTLQDNVTKQIVTELSLNLTGDQGTHYKTTSAQAYDAFLKGWAHYQRRSIDDLKKAIPHLEQAIQLSEEYTQAHSALAAVYWEIWNNGWADKLSIPPSDVMIKAKLHLQQAMKEATPLAHWVASNIAISEGNYQSAISEAKQIVEMDSNNAAGYAQLASALELSGMTGESAEVIQKAVRLDPYSSPFHAAVQKGDADVVRQLIDEDVQIDARNHYGKTPLHVVAESGQAEIAELLLEGGAEIEVRTSGGMGVFGATPLMLAARSGQAGVTELLVLAGADVNAVENYYLSGRSVLQFAAESGQTGVAEILIANGADLEIKSGQARATPLFMAARKGDLAMAELFISKGANVNAVDGYASTPLHVAVVSGDVDMVQLLITKGADLNAKTAGGGYPGETPLHVAAFAGQTQIAELLLANNADVNANDQYGYTPLRRAVDQGHLAMVELLVKMGADATTRDTNGVTLLHAVAYTDHVSIAELLIAGGADINAKDNNSGFTPLDYAQDGEKRMIETLEQHGAICTTC